MTPEPKWMLIETHHAVAAAGRVLDAATRKPMPGCRVEIIGGPPAYDRLLALLAQDPAWAARRNRLDRAITRTDGVFVFLDLPPGEYRLRIVPIVGGQSGLASGFKPEQEAPVTVFDERDPAGRLRLEPIDVELTPTRIQGRVTRAEDGEPIAGARVRLVGGYRALNTDSEGRYALTRLAARQPTVEASAPGFITARVEHVAITPGSDHTVDLELAAAPE
jgi:hypothetical protein